MNYYKIRTNPELIGKREVVPLWEYDTDAPNAQSNLGYTSLPSFEPNFSKLYIDKKTDVLEDGGIGGKGFLINRKLKDLLSKSKLDIHQFYELDTYYYEKKEKVDENFFWFQIISTNFERWIDYKKSKFYLFDDFEEEKIKDLSIKNANQLLTELKNTLNTDNLVMYSELVFDYHFQNYDLFYLDGLYENLFNYPIVSERLKNEIEENAIIAFEFKKVNIQFNE